ncbi:DUF6221 family protein [Streptomyces sp. NBC_01280]|uniref:DUF6221 family protein n=1 Tax=Streptomyces sp. NBC_01280 TaxID=2903810 RepID=UPI002E31414A|nr:DUF6221 family protein [Streptomyces sp. NBC_01280]
MTVLPDSNAALLQANWSAAAVFHWCGAGVLAPGDLVTFLHTRLDEEVDLARRCDGDGCREWTAHGHTVVFCQGELSGSHPTIALHVALRDPARVLREVEAKRRVLARHVLSPAGDSRRGKNAILTIVDYDCQAFAESGVEV